MQANGLGVPGCGRSPCFQRMGPGVHRRKAVQIDVSFSLTCGAGKPAATPAASGRGGLLGLYDKRRRAGEADRKGA